MAADISGISNHKTIVSVPGAHSRKPCLKGMQIREAERGGRGGERTERGGREGERRVLITILQIYSTLFSLPTPLLIVWSCLHVTSYLDGRLGVCSLLPFLLLLSRFCIPPSSVPPFTTFHPSLFHIHSSLSHIPFRKRSSEVPE